MLFARGSSGAHESTQRVWRRAVTQIRTHCWAACASVRAHTSGRSCRGGADTVRCLASTNNQDENSTRCAGACYASSRRTAPGRQACRSGDCSCRRSYGRPRPAQAPCAAGVQEQPRLLVCDDTAPCLLQCPNESLSAPPDTCTMHKCIGRSVHVNRLPASSAHFAWHPEEVMAA